MFNLKLTLQSITLLMVGLSLIPRLLTPYALKTGTIYILFFWLPLLVILPEIFKGYESEKKPITKLPKFTLFVLALATFIILTSMFYKSVIYNDSSEPSITLIRWCLYLVHPLICISLYPFLKKEKRTYFLWLLIFLTALMGFSMLVSILLRPTVIIDELNNLTAEISAMLMALISDSRIHVDGNTFGNSNFEIKVIHGCSSINQIIISLNSIIVFYLCCKIKSKIRIAKIVLFAIIVSFLFNSIRVMILAKIVEMDKMEMFKFWHVGAGSFIFSFITMSCCSVCYYFLWCKENPLENKEQQLKS